MIRATLRAACVAAVLEPDRVARGTGERTPDYPNRPIRIIVPYSPGGGSDTLARILADKLQARWRQPIVVENKTGAGGNIGMEAAFRAKPDGYTVLFTPQPPLVVNAFLYRSLSFDPALFEPAAVMAVSYGVLYVHPRLPVHNLADFIQYAKQRPGELNYASQGAGTSTHLCMELLNSMAGIRTTHVPYKGSAPATLALVSGETDAMLGEVATLGPYAAAGKVRMIAVASPKRIAAFPETPAMTETLPGFDCMLWQGLVAPPGTPAAVTRKWAAAIAEVAQMPDVAKRMREMNMAPGVGASDDMKSFLRDERVRWSKVITTSGAKAD